MVVWSATVDELCKSVAVVDVVTSRDSAAVKAAREVVGEVVEPLPAYIGSHLEVMAALKSEEVINKLVIGLIPLNRKVACTSDA